MESKLTHNARKVLPKMQADVDRLESIFKLFDAQATQVSECISSVVPLDGSIIAIAPGVFGRLLDTNKFEGLAVCTHCVSRAAMLLRDLAVTCEDLVTEAEKTK